jgi:hypothetical protein
VGPEDLTRKIIKGKISFDEEGNLKVDLDLTRSGINLARVYDTNGKLLVEISILSLLRNYETNTTTIGHDSTFTIPKQSLPGGWSYCPMCLFPHVSLPHMPLTPHILTPTYSYSHILLLSRAPSPTYPHPHIPLFPNALPPHTLYFIHFFIYR